MAQRATKGADVDDSEIAIPRDREPAFQDDEGPKNTEEIKPVL